MPNVSKLVFVTFSFNTNILLQVTNDYIKNSGNDRHITAMTCMLASGHQGLVSGAAFPEIQRLLTPPLFLVREVEKNPFLKLISTWKRRML